MSITKSGNTVTYTEPSKKRLSDETGVQFSDGFAIADSKSPLKQLQFDCSSLTDNVTQTLKASGAANTTITLPSSTAVLAADGLPTLAVQKEVPTTGQTKTVSADKRALVLDPAGTLDELTVVMPTAPADGTVVRIVSTEIVTALTHSAGGSDSIVGAATALAANTPIGYIYVAADTAWYRI